MYGNYYIVLKPNLENPKGPYEDCESLFLNFKRKKSLKDIKELIFPFVFSDVDEKQSFSRNVKKMFLLKLKKRPLIVLGLLNMTIKSNVKLFPIF